jgi:hypothetical protein
LPITLHEASAGTFLRFLAPLDGLLDKAEAHCRDTGSADEALTGARLCDDMWDFAKQVEQCFHHSRNAIAGAREGVFSPLLGDVPHDFGALRATVQQARQYLEAVTPEELEAIADNGMEFRHKTMCLPFVVKDFLLYFSVPNFFFHLTTAYGILRNRGLAVGKMDYLGPLPVKPG